MDLTTESTGKFSKSPTIVVTIERGEAEKQEYRFASSFRIGRDESCDISINDSLVSREHLQIILEENRWRIRDPGSTNGTFMEGRRINEFTIRKPVRLELGKDGPVIFFELEGSPETSSTMRQEKSNSSMEDYVAHYFSDAEREGIGEHTRMIRQAFHHIQKKERSKYTLIISGIAIISLLVVIYAVYQHRQASRLREVAENAFYSMKEIELKLAQLENAARITGDEDALNVIARNRNNQEKLEQKYDEFLDELNVYSEGLSEEERIIFRISRIFGECELTMPKDFVDEVKNYINKWKTTDRLEKAVRRATRLAYPQKIAEVMIAHHLPPHFFYLALQESDFKPRRVGPKTRYGYAKGYWQFIPKTAAKYGLKTGPLVELSQFDPKDERFDFGRATRAAASYIRDIYDTEAQASGFLVMASYNWGEDKVVKLIETMPHNPRERNFWQLLKTYKNQIPQQTYDYVFYIISAAVIGENPGLFGFDFDNPLKEISQTAPAG